MSFIILDGEDLTPAGVDAVLGAETCDLVIDHIDDISDGVLTHIAHALARCNKLRSLRTRATGPWPIDLFQFIRVVLIGHPTLVSLDLTEDRHVEIGELKDMLEAGRHISCLKLGFVEAVTDDAVDMLLELLPHLTHVDLTECRLTRAGTDRLLDAAAGHPTLVNLFLGGNPASGIKLAMLITLCPKLRGLTVTIASGGTNVVDAVAASNRLTYLEFRRATYAADEPPASSFPATKLAAYLRTPTCALRMLRLVCVRLTSAAQVAVCAACGDNTSLRCLYMCPVNMSREAAAAIMNSLRRSSIPEVFLPDTLTRSARCDLSEAIRCNTSLRHVTGAGERTQEQLVELAARYRAPCVRAIVRTRALVKLQRAAGARTGTAFAWLCVRAPLWVCVAVCKRAR